MVLNKVTKVIKQETSRPISLAASFIYLTSSLIAIFNTLFTTWSFDAIAGNAVMLPVFPLESLPVRILVWLFFEICLATMFGWVMSLLFDRGGGLPAMLLIFVSLVAAWTSLLNIQWLIVQGLPTSRLLIIQFAFALLVAVAVDIYLLNYYWQKLCDKKVKGAILRFSQEQVSRKKTLIMLKVISMLIMCFLLFGLDYLHYAGQEKTMVENQIHVTSRQQIGAI